MANSPRDDIANGMNAIYDLIYLAEVGEFYEDHDHSCEVLVRAKDGFESVREAVREMYDRLSRAEYERDDARRNEERANGRLDQMRDAIGERDETIAYLRERNTSMYWTINPESMGR